MQCWDWSRLIRNLFEQRRSQDQSRDPSDRRKPTVAMYFRLQVEHDNNGYEKDGNTHHPEWERHHYAAVHVLITRWPMVFVAETDVDTKLMDVPLDAWKNTSNHDSCWPEGFGNAISQAIFKGWDKCWEHVPEEHQQLPREASRVQLQESWLGKTVFSFARIEHEAAEPHDNYFRRITKITPLKAYISYEEPAS